LAEDPCLTEKSGHIQRLFFRQAPIFRHLPQSRPHQGTLSYHRTRAHHRNLKTRTSTTTKDIT
jgi:hypothetical protein